MVIHGSSVVSSGVMSQIELVALHTLESSRSASSTMLKWSCRFQAKKVVVNHLKQWYMMDMIGAWMGHKLMDIGSGVGKYLRGTAQAIPLSHFTHLPLFCCTYMFI